MDQCVCCGRYVFEGESLCSLCQETWLGSDQREVEYVMENPVYAVDEAYLAWKTAEETMLDRKQVETTIRTVLSLLTHTLVQKTAVGLGSELGHFTVKYRDGSVRSDSPRTASASRYTVLFKTGLQLKKRLRVPIEPGETGNHQKGR